MKMKLYLETFQKVRTKIVSVLTIGKKKVKVSHSLIAVGAVGVRVPLYLGHS